jgi:hypothetical protein
MSRLYILDFDRTLFDTDRFQRDIVRVVMPGNPQAFIEAIPSFTDSQTGLYDLIEQARSQAGISKSQLIALMDEKMPDDDYCFPDVAPWIKSHTTDGVSLTILSVGAPDYQGLKFARAPSCAHISKRLVNSAKGALLGHELTGQKQPYRVSFVSGTYNEIFLVDDRMDHLDKLQDTPGLTTVHVARPDGKYSTSPVSSNINVTITQFGELE